VIHDVTIWRYTGIASFDLLASESQYSLGKYFGRVGVPKPSFGDHTLLPRVE